MVNSLGSVVDEYCSNKSKHSWCFAHHVGHMHMEFQIPINGEPISLSPLLLLPMGYFSYCTHNLSLLSLDGEHSIWPH